MRDRSELVRRLRGGPLSRAVRWYDPGVLVHCGIRDLISSAFGEYADQRLMQAATCGVLTSSSQSTLILRRKTTFVRLSISATSTKTTILCCA